jgi:hypothetical protein
MRAKRTGLKCGVDQSGIDPAAEHVTQAIQVFVVALLVERSA